MLSKIKKTIILIRKINQAKKNGSLLNYTTRVDANTHIGRGTRVMNNNIICSTTIGDCTTIGANNYLCNVFIGSFCSIGSNVRVLDSCHPIYKPFVSSSPCFYKTLYPMPLIRTGVKFKEKTFNKSGISVEIGNDVWIGTNVIIIGNIKIGDGAVIGAGSIVTKNVDPYTVVAGNPAKIVRERYDLNTIKKLIEIKWWNWPLEIIERRKEDFSNIEVFVKKYGTK